MRIDPQPAGPEWHQLFAMFPERKPVPNCVPIAVSDMPPVYARLLNHNHHMTVTVEAFFATAVDVRVLASRQMGDWYAREILLVTRHNARVVQSGIVRLDLSVCESAVREAILAEQTPLGRVLIEHNVLREIEITSFLQVSSPTRWFDSPAMTYGRLGYIHCDGKPAVELLEVLAPIIE